MMPTGRGSPGWGWGWGGLQCGESRESICKRLPGSLPGAVEDAQRRDRDARHEGVVAVTPLGPLFSWKRTDGKQFYKADRLLIAERFHK